MVEIRVGVYESYKGEKIFLREYGFCRTEGESMNYCAKTPQELGMRIWETFKSPKTVKLKQLDSENARGTSSKLLGDDFDFCIERDLSQSEYRETLAVISREQRR